MSADTAANGAAPALASVRPTHVRWYVLALISLMYMITYMDRSNISIAAPAIAREFGFSKTEIALLRSALLSASARPAPFPPAAARCSFGFRNRSAVWCRA